MQSVTITKTDDGQYEVSSGASMGMSPSAGKSVPDLQSALMQAAKMLEQPAEQGMSPFDQGIQKNMPVNGSMGKMGM